MYLSRAYLNTEDSQVIQDLGDIYELHITVSSLFPTIKTKKSFRREYNVLYRMDTNKDQEAPFLLIQSKIVPKWSQLLEKYPKYFKGTPESKEILSFLDKLKEGQRCIFRLKASPVKRPPPKKYGKGEYRGNTNRIPIQNEGALMKWLKRKGASAGFDPIEIKTTREDNIYDIKIIKFSTSQIKTPFQYRKITGKKKNHIIVFYSVLFEGRLKINKLNEFKKTLINGIGPGKAFGFGMLSIYPIG